jgi:hypothetical protein
VSPKKNWLMNKPTVLCLNCHQFNRDVAELMASSVRYNFVPIADTFLSNTQKAWAPERLQVQTYYVNETGPDVDRAWRKSKEFGLALIADARANGMDVVAVMAGNWDYWNEECMRLACQELDLPFLVLLREHDLTGIRKQVQVDYFRHAKRIPEVTAVACAGQQSVDLFADDLKMIPRAKMRATGWPRQDIWRRPVMPRYDRPVVLMSYLKGYNAESHFLNEMLPLFSDIARSNPGIPFLLKAKHFAEKDALANVVQQRGLTMEVVDVLNLPSLICNARAVVGFHSAIMYEALLAPAPILIPQWGETAQQPDALAPSPSDNRLAGHMAFVSNPLAMREAIAALINGPTIALDMAARRATFGEFFTYTTDRTGVERIEDFVADFIAK